jgi:hypothetical protein
MKRIIFYSWQSDLPSRTNRGFIQIALERAAKVIEKDKTVDDAPIIDRDTAGVPGAPRIARTIFEKIAAADVLVADVSIVGGRQEQRPAPNPNVLIELGYALCSLEDRRLILVFNTAYGKIEELPFDLKMHRIMPYHMPDEAADRADERSALQGNLEKAVRAALGNPKPSAPSKAEAFLTELGPRSSFYIGEPRIAPRSEQYYQFLCAPHDDGATQSLTQDVERQFSRYVTQIFEAPQPQEPPQRGNKSSTFIREDVFHTEQRMAVTGAGAIGFVTLACRREPSGLPMFMLTEFLHNLGCFLACAALFYRKAAYEGGVVLKVAVKVPQTAQIVQNATRSVQVRPTHLFSEPLFSMKADELLLVQELESVHRLSAEQMLDSFESIMLGVARHNGRALSNTFRSDVRPIVDVITGRLESAPL